MSLLNWQLTPDGVLVMSDTLCTMNEEPHKFVPKVTHLAHLDMLMGLTGYHNIFLQWNHLLSEQAPGLGIDDLDDFAASALPVLWGLLFPFGTEFRTTVRHWGWSRKEGRFVGRSFRSVDGFAAEVMPDGFGWSPDPAPGVDPGAVETFSDMVEVAMSQQAFGLTPPEGERRTFVGGDLILHTMDASTGAVVTTSQKVRQFADYEAHLEAVQRLGEWPKN